MHAEQAFSILLDGLLENNLVSFGVPAHLQHVVNEVDEPLAAGRKGLKSRNGAEEDHQREVESEEGVD